jgi:hypothetical protein
MTQCINIRTKYFSCFTMASVEPEPVTEQPEQSVLDVAPPTDGVSPSDPGAWSSALCGCFGDIKSCKYLILLV